MEIHFVMMLSLSLQTFREFSIAVWNKQFYILSGSFREASMVFRDGSDFLGYTTYAFKSGYKNLSGGKEVSEPG